MNNILKVNLDDNDNDININNNYNEKKEKISSKVKTKFEDIIFLSSSILKKVNLENIFKLYSSDYCIFLKNKFFKNNIVCFNFKKSLLEYFDKYEVVYLNYSEKNNIINIINIINKFIENSDEKEKEKFLFDINLRFKLNLKKIKVIFFNENIVEPDILFKKIQFSNQEVYIIFNNYIIKKTEYKLRIFCQIAEKLGAEKIIINYYSF